MYATLPRRHRFEHQLHPTATKHASTSQVKHIVPLLAPGIASSSLCA